MAAPRLSDDQRQELVSRFRSGASTQELAEGYGCSPNTVIRVVKSVLEPAQYEDLKRQRSRRPSPAAPAGGDGFSSPGSPAPDGLSAVVSGDAAAGRSSSRLRPSRSRSRAPQAVSPSDPGAPVAPISAVALHEPLLAADGGPGARRGHVPVVPGGDEAEDARDEEEEDLAPSGGAMVLAIDDADDFAATDEDEDDGDDDDDADDNDQDDSAAAADHDDRDAPLSARSARSSRGRLTEPQDGSAFVAVPLDLTAFQDRPLTSPLPWRGEVMPESVYMLVDKTVELQARPLAEIPELGRLAPEEEALQALVLYSNPRQAKRQCGRTQRVIKLPDTAVLERTAPYLLRQGIRRVVLEGTLYALPEA